MQILNCGLLAGIFSSTERSKAVCRLGAQAHQLDRRRFMSSPILKSFTFVPQPKPSSDPLIIKRERMIARLEDQKKLLADPMFVRTIKRWERRENGEKVLVEKPLRTSRWWQADQSDGYVMTMKVGS